MSFTDLGIPPSTATVSVTAFNAVDPRTVSVLANTLMKPVGAGHELFRFPIFTFLITHAASGRRVLFDLGVRKDLENTAPAVAADVRAGLIVMPVERDFVEQLGDYGVEAGSISAAIWSHAHFDHIGDVSKFRASTDLVFGVGTPCETRPSHPHAMLMESDLAGRNLVPIAFDESSLQIGGFKAHDYFGDGSLYLLDVPGHLSGHMCALTRVTPTSFLFLGGDAAHHVGMLRPTAALHRAFPAPPALLTSTKRSVALTAIAPASNDTTDAKPFDLAARTSPLLDVAEGGYYEDAPTSRASIALISAFDANPDVLVVLAHDESLLEIVGPAFPAKLDGWKERGWKERAVWAFLEEGNAAFRFGDKVEVEGV
ncbi:beta-lactamase-like protein [Mycena metata]|uniref:Beta-lactamase-like protein n=1 Tax=Mycena metata TaxID=1033252 RepID=A0AAD7HCT1_9AGAR|nr:beta-lactamase-like protein [Mycena metata]